jgi:decaprenylphospho-beta-D-ribofuranose 2-oxidase
MNAVLYGRYARSSGGPRPVSFRSYFYPLDAIENWNQLYGRAGFIEYQAIVPEARASVLIRDVLDMLAAAGQPSYFASLKLMGLGNQGPLSFPMPGVAFSFDVPQCGELLPLLDRIDEKLAAAGGRVYLAKDARCRADVMDTFYPGRRAWAQLVRRGDPTAKFSSDMARRLRLRL